WGADSEGHWEVKVDRAGVYKITIYAPGEFSGYDLAGRNWNSAGGIFKDNYKDKVTFESTLAAGDDRVAATVTLDQKSRAAHYIEFEYIGPVKK
ncbi:MAG: hypothetical protein K2V38_05225, partial [Gemmataceae bacterium]|nr:hypothetical protein [Gemmataceae bacterium]